MTARAAQNAAPHRAASLDLLRGFAAFGVAIPHYILVGPDAAPHWEAVSVVAVEIFFVLSGFVLGPQILDCARNGFSDLRVFLVRRWMRTIPPYLFALAMVSLMAGKLFSADFWRYALYIQNFSAQHNADDYYPVAWSLSIEEWFYVSFPLMLLAIIGFTGRCGTRPTVLIAVVFIMIVTAARFWYGIPADWGADVRRVVVFRVDSIAYGFLLYVALSRGVIVGANFVGSLLAFGLCAMLVYAVTLAIPQHAAFAQLFPFCAAAAGASAIVLFRSCEPILRRHRWAAEFCFFTGGISYSVYLFHLSIAVWLRGILDGMPTPMQLLIYVCCCIVGSSVFFRYFERPILTARPGYPKRDSALVESAL